MHKSQGHETWIRINLRVAPNPRGSTADWAGASPFKVDALEEDTIVEETEQLDVCEDFTSSFNAQYIAYRAQSPHRNAVVRKC